MRNVLSILICLFTISVINAQDGLPTNPKPGACYVKCVTADEFRTVEEKIMVKAGYTKLEVVPGTFKTVEERVMVKEASKKLVYVPAVYETVEVSYQSKEASSTLTVEAASFANATEVVQTSPTTSGWQYTAMTNCKSNNPGDCQVLCYTETPASSRTINVQRLASDASTNTIAVGGQMATYKKQVVKTAARMDEIEIPAEYATIKKQVVDRPADVKRVTVEPEYVTVSKTEIVKKGGVTSYTEIDCKLVNYSSLPILYNLGSAALTNEAKSIIDNNIYEMMVGKPEISVEIASHTDARGDDNSNLSLSQRRAESVVNYLVSKGIKRGRLVAKGFGETKLLNRCANGVECSESEHQKNRRTEFRVIQ